MVTMIVPKPSQAPNDTPPASKAVQPLGIFDSGVGGLTVVREIVARRPGQPILYVADQAHVPYGDRPLEEIAHFAGALTAYLFDQGCQQVIMACNISSSVALEAARTRFGAHRVHGVIEPGVREALAVTRCHRIGVLATSGTVKSAAYSRQFHALSKESSIFEIPCPEFVPLIESNETESERAREAAERRVAPLVAAGVDTIVLGCTHYPYLLAVLHTALKNHQARFVDPAAATARTVTDHLSFNPGSARHRFLTTRDPDAFRAQVERIAPELGGAIDRVDWRSIEKAALQA